MTTLSLRVARKTIEAEGIASFELVPADGGPLPAFTAGAHVDVQVPGGPQRPYSLCNDPAETHRYVIAVLDEPASRGGSRGMHERVHEGDMLQVGAPRNLFPLAPGAARHLLLAGGIGITPILAMAWQLGREGAEFELHYCARTPQRAAFAGPLAEAAFAERVHLHFDDGAPAQRLDIAAVLAAQPAGTHLYVCGPNGFMDAVLGAARDAGWADERLHREVFAPALAPASDEAGDRGFEVQLLSTGQVVEVPAGCSVVRALEAAGVFVPTSCEQGVCGTCLTGVVEGVPEHRDSYLTPEEHAAGDQFLPCCSRARSARLVLDL